MPNIRLYFYLQIKFKNVFLIHGNEQLSLPMVLYWWYLAQNPLYLAQNELQNVKPQQKQSK